MAKSAVMLASARMEGKAGSSEMSGRGDTTDSSNSDVTRETVVYSDVTETKEKSESLCTAGRISSTAVKV